MSATPRPWTCCAKNYKGRVSGIIRDQHNWPVADCRYTENGQDQFAPHSHSEIHANAQLIVEAVNAYDALQKENVRLREALQSLIKFPVSRWLEANHPIRYLKAKAALLGERVR